MNRPHDDSPDPVRSTPARLFDELGSIGVHLARLSIRARELAPWIPREKIEPLVQKIHDASCLAVDLGSAVRVGAVPIAAALVDRSAGRGERPLIEKIEENRKPLFDGLESSIETVGPPAVEPVGDQVEDGEAGLGIYPGDLVFTSDNSGPYLVKIVSRRGEKYDLSCVRITDPLDVAGAQRTAVDSWIQDCRRDGDRFLTGKKNRPYAAIPGQPEVFMISPDQLVAKFEEIQRWRPDPPAVIEPDFERQLEADSDADAEERSTDPIPNGTLPVVTGADLFPEEAAAEKRARKRAADAAYQKRKREAKLLARAIGNPVESTGSTAPPIGREPVIAGPTKPVERLAPVPEEWRSIEIDAKAIGIGYTTCAVLRGKGLKTAGQVADALNEEFALIGLTEEQVVGIERAINHLRGKPKRPKPEPEPDPLADLFVYWGEGKAGKRTNPVYGIRAPSLAAAIAYVKSQHPPDAVGEVRPDMEGTIAKHKLTVRDLIAKPAEPVVDRPRKWEAYDLRFSPPVLMGEVTGVNSTRAIMAAEAEWPNTPKRMIELREKGVRTKAGRGPKPAEPDRDLANFRREFDDAGEAEAERLESRPADPEPARNGRRKRSESVS